MRGRRPTPSALRLLRGDQRKQAVNSGRLYVQPPPEPLEPPEYLSPAAKAVWTELAPELHPIGWLTNLDAPAFGAYCTVVARWRDAEVLIDAGEDTPSTRRMARDLARDVVKMGEHFGLSPQARTRISIVQPEKPGKFDGLLGSGPRLVEQSDELPDELG